MGEKPITYRPYIDGLRAIAVLSVVVFHANATWLPGGFLGVDLFFVISGFLITRLIADELEAGSFSFWAFYLRRARRLLPASFVVLLVTTALAAWYFSPEDFTEFGQSLTAVALFHANLYFDQNTGYFDGPAELKPLLHFWSLAIEEQFYFIWPAVLFGLWFGANKFVRRLSSRGIAISLLLVLSLASLGFADWGARQPNNASFFSLPARAWELGVGGLVGLSLPSSSAWLKRIPKMALEVGTALGLLAIFASLIFVSEDWVLPGFWGLPLVLGTALVLALNAERDTRMAGVLTVRPLVFVGLISYSLYLWHWPIFVFARVSLGIDLGVGGALVLILVALSLAYLSWRYVEAPFRRRQVLVQNSKAMVIAVSCLLVFGLAGVLINAAQGLPQRFTGPEGRFYVQMSQGSPWRQRCDGWQKIAKDKPGCLVGVTQSDKAVELLLIGDSAADQWLPAVDVFATEFGLIGKQATQSACAPVLGYIQKRRPVWRRQICENYQNALVAYLEANPQVNHVVLSGNWRSYIKPVVDRTALGQRFAMSENPANFAEVFEPTLGFFKARGIKVMLVGIPPISGRFDVDCINGPKASGCLREMKDYDQRYAALVEKDYFEPLAVSNDDVSFETVLQRLCVKTHCAFVQGDTMMYRDGGHLSRAGVLKMGAEFDWFSSSD